MGTKRRIPYGVINWARLVHECLFVDNRSSVKSATGPADCIDKLRNVVLANNLPPIYVIIDEYDNFTNEPATFTFETDSPQQFYVIEIADYEGAVNRCDFPPQCREFAI